MIFGTQKSQNHVKPARRFYLRRFASLLGGTTKQSRKEVWYLDCFVPRNDAMRR